MSKTITDWSTLALEAEHIMRSSKDTFDPATVENVRDFLQFATKHLQVASGVVQGYWPTVRIYWSMPQEPEIEVEVHEDHYEYYGIYDGRSNIRHYDHKPGEVISEEFTDLLPK